MAATGHFIYATGCFACATGIFVYETGCCTSETGIIFLRSLNAHQYFRFGLLQGNPLSPGESLGHQFLGLFFQTSHSSFIQALLIIMDICHGFRWLNAIDINLLGTALVHHDSFNEAVPYQLLELPAHGGLAYRQQFRHVAVAEHQENIAIFLNPAVIPG